MRMICEFDEVRHKVRVRFQLQSTPIEWIFVFCFVIRMHNILIFGPCSCQSECLPRCHSLLVFNCWLNFGPFQLRGHRTIQAHWCLLKSPIEEEKITAPFNFKIIFLEHIELSGNDVQCDSTEIPNWPHFSNVLHRSLSLSSSILEPQTSRISPGPSSMIPTYIVLLQAHWTIWR